MMNSTEDRCENEIELMDYLRVIWKWKYLIVLGTLICAAAALMISYYTPKTYRFDMVIRPGIVRVTSSGTEIYVDTPKNIKGFIEAGAFNREILDSISEPNGNSRQSLKFNVTILEDANAVKVSYESSDAERGLRILNQLGGLLSKKLAERVAYFQNDYKMEMDLKQTELTKLEVERKAGEWHVEHLQKRIDELRSEIESIRKNINSLIRDRAKFLSGSTNENNSTGAVLYTVTIQENMALETSYRLEINDYMSRQAHERIRLEKSNIDEKILSQEINNLKLKKDDMQNMQIIQAPIASPYPTKPKIKLNVMLGTIAGLFCMVFLAFFLEYIQKHRGERAL